MSAHTHAHPTANDDDVTTACWCVGWAHSSLQHLTSSYVAACTHTQHSQFGEAPPAKKVEAAAPKETKRGEAINLGKDPLDVRVLALPGEQEHTDVEAWLAFQQTAPLSLYTHTLTLDPAHCQ